MYISGVTPFHEAAFKGFTKICEIIMEEIKDKNPKDKVGMTPFHVAAQWGHVEICNLIMDNIVDIYPKMNNGMTPYFLAEHNKRKEIIDIILSYNPNNKQSRKFLQAQGGEKIIEDTNTENNLKSFQITNEEFDELDFEPEMKIVGMNNSYPTSNQAEKSSQPPNVKIETKDLNQFSVQDKKELLKVKMKFKQESFSCKDDIDVKSDISDESVFYGFESVNDDINDRFNFSDIDDKNDMSDEDGIPDKDDITVKDDITLKDDITVKDEIIDKDDITDKNDISDEDGIPDIDDITEKDDINDKNVINDKDDIINKDCMNKDNKIDHKEKRFQSIE